MAGCELLVGRVVGVYSTCVCTTRGSGGCEVEVG